MKVRQLITRWEDVPIIMDLPFAARIIGVTPEALTKRCQKGTFPAYKEGSLWRVEKEAFRRHVEKNSNAYGRTGDTP